MKQTTLLRIAGIITLLFTSLHFTFPLMPDWDISKKGMTKEIWNIFITYHYAIIVIIGIFGYIAVFQAKRLIESPVKNSVLLLFSSIYIIRIITEFTCWEISFPQSIIIIVLCLLPVICYFYVIFSPVNNKF